MQRFISKIKSVQKLKSIKKTNQQTDIITFSRQNNKQKECKNHVKKMKKRIKVMSQKIKNIKLYKNIDSNNRNEIHLKTKQKKQMILILSCYNIVIDSSQNPQLFKIQMNPQKELERKYQPTQNYKTTIPNNNVINGKQWKRSDVSREKEDKKNIHDRQQPKILAHLPDDNLKNNVKAINFKNLKDTLPKKQSTTNFPSKNNIHPVKPNIQYYHKNIRPQPQSHGISINVNIQNMLPPKTMENVQVLPMSDRSLLGQDKKSKKIMPTTTVTQKFDDFQCKEQLNYKRTPIQKENKFTDKTVQKRPLIDRKHHKSDVHQKPKQKILDYKEQIKKFQNQIQAINSAAQAEAVSYLDFRQQAYLVPPHYIQKNQKNFSWKMRATLLDWMMHVSYQFSLKRQTFYISVHLVDLYMSKQYHLPKSQFQLAGAAAMFIASKLEQFQPKCSQQFAQATNTYSALQVKEMQKKICKTLKFTLNPPTLSGWANRFMLQWDAFLEQNTYAQKHPIFATCQHKYFKKCDNDSYRRYRTMMQLLDCATLQIQTVQYQPKLLVCAFMYLILGKDMGMFKLKQITNQFPRSSLYLIDQDNLFNDLFMTFLQNSFNIMLIDLLPTVQYCATYFILPLNFQDPITNIDNQNQLQNIQFEDFCSFQTYNPHLRKVITDRFRGIYE